MTIHHDKLAYGKLASSRQELTDDELLAMLEELNAPESDEKENKTDKEDNDK